MEGSYIQDCQNQIINFYSCPELLHARFLNERD